jgi:hypothetical protein
MKGGGRRSGGVNSRPGPAAHGRVPGGRRAAVHQERVRGRRNAVRRPRVAAGCVGLFGVSYSVARRTGGRHPDGVRRARRMSASVMRESARAIGIALGTGEQGASSRPFQSRTSRPPDRDARVATSAGYAPGRDHFVAAVAGTMPFLPCATGRPDGCARCGNALLASGTPFSLPDNLTRAGGRREGDNASGRL